MKDLEDKVILITGGTSGLGKAAATLLASFGAKVAFTGRRADQGAGVVKEIEAAGGDALFIKADVTSHADVEAMVGQTMAHYGRLDGAVNNAGISGPALTPAADITQEDWFATINTNLNAVWMSMKFEIPAILQSGGGGSIVNIASIYGLKGSDVGQAPYSASKFGVIGLSKTAAIDYGERGIRTNALCPGFCRSEMVDPDAAGMDATFAKLISRHSAMNRIGEADEVASAIAWLLSPSSSFINGAAIPIDGGTTSKLY